jgi:hypothetical protein
MTKSRLRLMDIAVSAVSVQHVLTSDVALSSTPVDGHTLALPSAGQWIVELADGVEAGTLTGTRDVTWQINVTDLVSMSIIVTVVRSNASSIPMAAVTANGVSNVLTGVPNAGRGRANASGIVIVSAPAVITTSTFFSAEAGNLKVGSFIKARKHA